MSYLSNYYHNLNVLAKCQAYYDNMQPPEYYEGPDDAEEEVIDPEEEE